MEAIILAGSPNIGPLRQSSNAPAEALIEIRGRPMITYVVRALEKVEAVDKIIIAGPQPAMNKLFVKNSRIQTIAAGATAIESLQRGVSLLDNLGLTLVLTADIPLITALAISNFLELCQSQAADFYYPIVPQRAAELEYPGIKRTYVRLREGVFTGGNLCLINAARLDDCAGVAQELVNLRKSPLAIAGKLGYGFIIKFLLANFLRLPLLGIPEAEERISNLLGVRGVAIVTAYPEIGLDVDKPSDLELVSRVI